MKAIIISRPGGPEVLEQTDKPIPVPGEGQILIRVMAAGINAVDAFQRKGHYPAPPGAPQDVPGLEVSGTVWALGGGVTKWVAGDAVCALLAGGGYAEYVVADAESCLPVPANMDLVAAAALPETVFTIWSNVFKRCNLKAGEHFLVHGGTSGIGTTAIQMAAAFGATVFATAGSKEKVAFCVKLGAEKCINYKEADFEKELAPHGIDVILDSIGGDYTGKNINILNPEGRLVFINAVKGNQLEGRISDIMRKRLWITGSTLRSREASFKAELAREILTNVWPLIEDGKLKPVIDTVFPLGDAAKAHQLLDSSTHIGKILLVNEW